MRKMPKNPYFSAKFHNFPWALVICLLQAHNHHALGLRSNRESLEIGLGIGIGIGAGGGSPPASPPEPVNCGCPPPPSSPQPSDFQDIRLYTAYVAIQLFKQTITCDPHGVTSSWNGTQVCNYRGFFCSNPPDNLTAVTVASVDFNGFSLCAPTIVGFIEQLPDLALFHANSNNFSGTLPDLSSLRYLYELDVSNNRMSGPFPANVLAVTRLIFLDLRFNAFGGSVPGTAFSLDLDVLFLNNNNFNQPLPGNLGSTTAAYLTLANNGFTGMIPRSLCNASSTLVEVLFLGNRLSGCIPYEVGLLQQATVFDAGYNQLTGPIPYSFGCLSRVEQLNLAGNHLYGQIPEVVCRLGSLDNLSLSDNYFTLAGPACWKLWKKGVLDVRRNCIPGFPMQRSPADCAAFFAKPRFCPFMSSYYYIPCKLPCNNSSSGADLVALRTPAPPPSYSALHRHRSQKINS